MKTRAQKETELANARVLFEKSEALIFADFTKITAENLRKLRTELKKSGANFLVIKKRILGILLKEKGIDVDLKQFKTSVGTIFSEVDSEHISGPAFKFFSGMEVAEGEAKDVWIKKILAGYDIKGNAPITAEDIIYIGKLPPREVVLAQTARHARRSDPFVPLHSGREIEDGWRRAAGRSISGTGCSRSSRSCCRACGRTPFH